MTHTKFAVATHKPTVIRIGDGTPPAYAALGGDTPENLKDHAAFIVRACNSHYAMLEALEEVMREAIDEHYELCDEDGVLSRARAAIAQAKETTND